MRNGEVYHKCSNKKRSRDVGKRNTETLIEQTRSPLILYARKKLTVTITKAKEILPSTTQKKLFKNHEKVL
jgi:hypothetical protein